MIGDAFRIATLGYAYNFSRHLKLLLLHNLEVAYDVDGSIRSYEGKLVEFVSLEELVFHLDDTLFSMDLAGEIDSYGYLILDAFEIEEVESLIYIFRRDVVEYRTVLQCAYY